jgi:hypothetical protein
MKNPTDPIENRTHDLLACTAEAQPPASPRIPNKPHIYYINGAWGSCATSRRDPVSNPGGVTWDFFRGASDGTMCPGVDSASKNEYQEFSWR